MIVCVGGRNHIHQYIYSLEINLTYLKKKSKKKNLNSMIDNLKLTLSFFSNRHILFRTTKHTHTTKLVGQGLIYGFLYRGKSVFAEQHF